MTDPIEQPDDDGLDPEDRDGTAVDADDPIVSPDPDAEAETSIVETEEP